MLETALERSISLQKSRPGGFAISPHDREAEVVRVSPCSSIVRLAVRKSVASTLASCQGAALGPTFS